MHAILNKEVCFLLLLIFIVKMQLHIFIVALSSSDSDLAIYIYTHTHIYTYIHLARILPTTQTSITFAILCGHIKIELLLFLYRCKQKIQN